MPPPKDPIKRKEWLYKIKRSALERYQNIEYKQKFKDSRKKMSQNPEWRRNHDKTMKDNSKSEKWIKNHKNGILKRSQNPEWKNNNKEHLKKLHKNPEWIKRNKEIGRENVKNPEFQKRMDEHNKMLSKNPDWILKNKNVGERNSQNPEWIQKNKEHLKKLHNDPDWKYKLKKLGIEYSKNPEWKLNHKKAMEKMSQNPKWMENNMESRIGGFWYGNIRYPDNNKHYCEKWNNDLRTRIREYFDNKSTLSGKTVEDNGGRQLSCHHVYYQKKACCIWDEDAQGYYAIIDGEKYYIKGDPNKFVTLTADEHGKVSKDKLKWIKLFEDLIDNEYNGKCYYTKEEYENLLR